MRKNRIMRHGHGDVSPGDMGTFPLSHFQWDTRNVRLCDNICEITYNSQSLELSH